MDTVTILRDLWRLRSAVVMVALLALIAGTAVIYKISVPPDVESRRYEVGIATVRILVDTPSSQVVEVAPKGSDSLGIRANLLASLMVDGVVKAAIAQRAGVPPRKLIGITEAATEPSPVAKPPSRDDFVLTTRVVTNAGGDQLPIIEIDVQAPDRAGAARLGAAALAGLRDYLDSKAARQQIADADRLQVTGLGAPRATSERRGPSTLLAIVLAIVIFAFGCGWILGILALMRNWRDASSREQLEGEGPAKESALHPVDDPTDDWFDAQPRLALFAPPSDGAAPREHDQPRAKSV